MTCALSAAPACNIDSTFAQPAFNGKVDFVGNTRHYEGDFLSMIVHANNRLGALEDEVKNTCSKDALNERLTLITSLHEDLAEKLDKQQEDIDRLCGMLQAIGGMNEKTHGIMNDKAPLDSIGTSILTRMTRLENELCDVAEICKNFDMVHNKFQSSLGRMQYDIDAASGVQDKQFHHMDQRLNLVEKCCMQSAKIHDEVKARLQKQTDEAGEQSRRLLAELEARFSNTFSEQKGISGKASSDDVRDLDISIRAYVDGVETALEKRIADFVSMEKNTFRQCQHLENCLASRLSEFSSLLDEHKVSTRASIDNLETKLRKKVNVKQFKCLQSAAAIPTEVAKGLDNLRVDLDKKADKEFLNHQLARSSEAVSEQIRRHLTEVDKRVSSSSDCDLDNMRSMEAALRAQVDAVGLALKNQISRCAAVCEERTSSLESRASEFAASLKEHKCLTKASLDQLESKLGEKAAKEELKRVQTETNTPTHMAGVIDSLRIDLCKKADKDQLNLHMSQSTAALDKVARDIMQLVSSKMDSDQLTSAFAKLKAEMQESILKADVELEALVIKETRAVQVSPSADQFSEPTLRVMQEVAPSLSKGLKREFSSKRPRL